MQQKAGIDMESMKAQYQKPSWGAIFGMGGTEAEAPADPAPVDDAPADDAPAAAPADSDVDAE